ncbi:FtsX-like permease family protein [Accumulibacter sp.]|uniref:ABC transporter permease n=1 Tax=Accumulibacter sp. TaxID=2053492 RepID=UPI0025EBB6F1|nr:FtsX-like permease family protein [Accumulibacter sp.]MCM8612271.1 ABC transporter permease [Accumulibacter sp.]MCM8635944.1 ABC transporter permease [Accumulibacter sp.]MCM8639447.1 ABC transporter permease [Accumulibacter sp.]
MIALSAVSFGIIALILAGGFIDWIFWAMRESTIESRLGHVQVTRPGYKLAGHADPFSYLLPKDALELEILKSLPQVRAIAPRLVFGGLISHGDASISFLGEGVDSEQEALVSRALTVVRGRNLAADDDKGVILGLGLAASLGVKVGDKVVLLTSTAAGGINAVEGYVRGVFVTVTKSYDDTALRVPIALARQLLRTEGSHVWVALLDRTESVDGVSHELGQRLSGEAFDVTPWHELADFYNKTVELFSRQVLMVKLIIAVIIVLSISNTLIMSVLERTGEIGTSMALGMTRDAVMRQFVVEGLCLGVIGGGVGVSVGVALAHIVSTIGIPMPPPPGMTQGYKGEILVSWRLISGAMELALGTTLVASIYPAWKASRMVIVDALRYNR